MEQQGKENITLWKSTIDTIEELRVGKSKGRLYSAAVLYLLYGVEPNSDGFTDKERWCLRIIYPTLKRQRTGRSTGGMKKNKSQTAENERKEYKNPPTYPPTHPPTHPPTPITNTNIPNTDIPITNSQTKRVGVEVEEFKDKIFNDLKVETACMSLGITPEQYTTLANEVLNDWVYCNEADWSDKHFLNTLRIKADVLKRSSSNNPVTRREEERRTLATDYAQCIAQLAAADDFGKPF